MTAAVQWKAYLPSLMCCSAMNDAIAMGILVKLNDEGKVVRCKQPNNRGGWELTDTEFAKRRDDI